MPQRCGCGWLVITTLWVNSDDKHLPEVQGGVKKVELMLRARDGQVLAGKTRKARGSPGRSVR